MQNPMFTRQGERPSNMEGLFTQGVHSQRYLRAHLQGLHYSRRVQACCERSFVYYPFIQTSIPNRGTNGIENKTRQTPSVFAGKHSLGWTHLMPGGRFLLDPGERFVTIWDLQSVVCPTVVSRVPLNDPLFNSTHHTCLFGSGKGDLLYEVPIRAPHLIPES
ncbi:hypothetical protein FA13DRAFT_1246593 [Coprinellus micaceus]|uniref:Uncharacterized protein n=1 Tax=Coprinellus micaceus TaxID=71717 RepID=A0A4Y7TQ57_COPMI|nr:hypothetical protein FA13DRAFT_1246593 [Coprinellus micaceus]